MLSRNRVNIGRIGPTRLAKFGQIRADFCRMWAKAGQTWAYFDRNLVRHRPNCGACRRISDRTNWAGLDTKLGSIRQDCDQARHSGAGWSWDRKALARVRVSGTAADSDESRCSVHRTAWRSPPGRIGRQACASLANIVPEAGMRKLSESRAGSGRNALGCGSIRVRPTWGAKIAANADQRLPGIEFAQSRPKFGTVGQLCVPLGAAERW